MKNKFSFTVRETAIPTWRLNRKGSWWKTNSWSHCRCYLKICRIPEKLEKELAVFKQMLFKPKNVFSGEKKKAFIIFIVNDIHIFPVAEHPPVQKFLWVPNSSDNWSHPTEHLQHPFFTTARHIQGKISTDPRLRHLKRNANKVSLKNSKNMQV